MKRREYYVLAKTKARLRKNEVVKGEKGAEEERESGSSISSNQASFPPSLVILLPPPVAETLLVVSLCVFSGSVYTYI